jgi:LysM repeat protein
MFELIKAQWRFLLVAVALILVAAGALAAGVAVLAQGQNEAPARQPMIATAAPSVNEAPAAAQSSAEVVQVQATPRPPQGVTYHTVKSGETLGKIAAAYGVSTAAIASANGISNPNMIYVGQRLMIPAR